MRYHILFAVILAGVLCCGAGAQDYSFSVPEMELHVTPNPDASVKLEYRITFACNAGAHAIDVVDMGLPHQAYDLGNIRAYLNGNPLTGIKKSSYIDCGVEVPLSPAISPGETGVFQFECIMPDLVYQDTTDKQYASLQITPTWWGSEFVTGTTKLGIVVYLPLDIQPDEILYQKEPFTEKITLANNQVAAWLFTNTRVDKAHLVGVSFPQRGMERVVRISKLGLLWKWWKDNPSARLIVGLILMVLFGVFFFRLTAGTGCSIFVLLVGGLTVLWASWPAAEAAFFPALLLVWILSERKLSRRRHKYLPALASVPGGGIKRGLAAPEAAVILEMPLGRVLTLTIFGILKKKLVTITQDDPLAVDLVADYQTEDRKERRRRARENGTVIRGYEQPFLETLIANPGLPVQDLDLSEAMKNLVDNTARRMSGFDLEQTREYYQSIIAKAWEEAKAIGELDQRTKHVDDNLLWMMMDDQYIPVFHSWHGSGYHYRPSWTHSAAPAGMPPAPAPAAVGGRTSLGDVAASFAGWSEKVTGNLVSSMDPVSLGVVSRGGIDLSGVDKVTMDVLESMAESSGSGGGGGGCACAGCACACACAGGGR